MPELISVPNSGSFKNKENTGSQMGHANKKIFSTVCARDHDHYELISCCKFVNEILFCITYKNALSYLEASCLSCDFVLVP